MLVIATQFLAKAIALPWLGRLGSRIGSLGLLHVGGLSVIPLTSLWLVSADVWFLMGVQFVAGICWAAYELALALLFFDAVPLPHMKGPYGWELYSYTLLHKPVTKYIASVKDFVDPPQHGWSVYGNATAPAPVVLKGDVPCH